MIGSCTIAPDTPLVPMLMGSVDCAADGLLADGYVALASPDSAVASALTGALTLFVGFYAYRLLLGRARLDAGQAALAMVKIGLVLVLAGNWAIYQQVVAHTLFDAPRALAELVLGGLDRHASGLSGTPMVALEQVFDELIRDTRSLSSHAGDRSPLLGGPAFATMMLNASAYIVVLSGAGMLAAVHLGLALLLALGPVVAGFLLFNVTQGMVEGWLRAMVTLATISLTTTILLEIEFRLLEPPLAALVQQRANDAVRPETALTVVLVIAIFALAQLGAIIAASTIAHGIRLPRNRAAAPERGSAYVPVGAAAEIAMPRADRVAQAVASNDRRSTSFRGLKAVSLGDGLASAERVRRGYSLATHIDTVAVGAPQHIRQRALRPRRELLVSRRKK